MKLGTQFLAIFIFAFSNRVSADLEAISANATLPVAREHLSGVYDGEDSIFIVGGRDAAGFSGTILKYSLTTESIDGVATLPWRNHGSGVWAGEIFYIGGIDFEDNRSTDIWRIDVNNPEDLSVVSNLVHGSFWSTAIWNQANDIYIVGGYELIPTNLRTIQKYSKDSNTVEEVAKLERKTYGASGVWDTTDDTMLIFGGSNSTGGNAGYTEIMRFDPKTGILITLEASLPEPLVFSCAVWTGTEAIIVGGSQELVSSIVRFNAATEQVSVETVNNFPPNLFGAGCAYVEKLQRIYVIGGYYYDQETDSWRTRDEVMYIDISNKISHLTK